MVPRARSLVFSLLLVGCPPPAYDPSAVYTSTLESSGAGSSSGESSSSGSSTTDGASGGSGSGGMTTGDASDGTSGAPETTGPVGICGDGVLDEGEECDDGDLEPNNGCDDGCFKDRVVFVTSVDYKSSLNGIMGALGICRQNAAQGELLRAETFMPWLSDSDTDAIDHVYAGKGRYVRPDGVVVAQDFESLLAGVLLAPINVDQYGMTVNAEVVTGTRPDGTRVPGTNHCNDWFGAGAFEEQLWFGSSGSTSSTWTLYTGPYSSAFDCGGRWHLYCFEGK